MADLVTRIGIEATGTSQFSKDMGESTEALTGFKGAAEEAKGAAEQLDSTTQTLASSSEGNAKTFESNMETAADEAAAAFLNVVGAILEVNAAIIATVNDVAAQGDAVAKGAQAINWSTDAYQKWDFVLKRSGSSMSRAAGAIKTLTDAATTGSDKQKEAFEALGLSLEDVAKMQPEELFGAVVSGLQGIEDQGLKLDIAKKLFGSYSSLGTLLSSTGDDVQNLTELAEKLNYVMSEEDIANAQEYQDSIDNLQDTINGIKRTVVDDLMPGITSVRDAFTDMLTQVDWNGLGAALQLVYEPAINFLNNFLIPLSGVALGGVAGTIGALATLIQNIKDVLSGDKTVSEALDEMWDFGDWNAEEPEKVLQEYEGLAEGIRDVQNEFYNDFNNIDRDGILGEDWNTEQIDLVSQSLETYREQLAATAAEAPNAAAANEQLGREIDALKQKYGELMLSGDTDQRLAYSEQLAAELTALSQKYQEIANQSPTEKTEEDAQQTAQEITAAGEKVAEGAATMLETFDSATGQLSDDFKSGTDEMSQAAVDSITNVNNAMNENMAIVSANAQIWGSDMMRSFANGLAAGWNDYTGPQLQAIAQEIQDMFGHSEPKTGPLANDSTWMPDMMASFAAGIRQNRGLVLGELDALAGGMAASVNVGGMGAGAGASYNYGGVNVTFNVPDGMNGRELYEEFNFWLQNDMAREGAVWGH